MPIPAVIVIALLLLEMFLLVCFITWYYKTGIVLFKERLPANAAARARLALHTLEGNILDNQRRPLVFMALSPHCMAFRRSQAPTFERRPFAIMRARVDVDHRRGEVRVVGMCSWFSVICPAVIVLAQGYQGAMLVLLLGLPLGGMAYLLQRTAFREVVKAVRWQLLDHEAIDLTQRQDTRQRPTQTATP